MTTVLVTGAAGFLGSRLCAALRQDGTTVLAVDNLLPQVHGDDPSAARELERLGVLLFAGDVTSVELWRLVAARCDEAISCVFHLAAETGTGQSLTDASSHARTNVLGTTRMLDSLHAFDLVPQRIVLPSSRAVYGEGEWRDGEGHTRIAQPRRRTDLQDRQWAPRAEDGTVLSEPTPHRAGTTTPTPSNVYAATKLAQEQIVRVWADAFGATSIVTRLQNVYGPGQAVGNPYTGVLTYFARQALDGERIHVFEGGAIVRDFVFVDDVVTVLQRAATDVGTSCVLDVGSGRAATLLEVGSLLARLSQAPAPAVTDDFRHGDVRAAWADRSRLDDVLPGLTSTPLETGLDALLAGVSDRRGRDVSPPRRR